MFKVKEGLLIGGKAVTGSGATEVLTAADVGSMAYQNSDSFIVSSMTTANMRLDDADSSYYLNVQSASTNTADRTLTIDVNDASRILELAGNAVLVGTNTGDQVVSSGTLGLAIGSAGATNTSVTIGTGSGFNANTASNFTYDIKIGPGLSALTAIMTGGTAGFIKKSSQDTYTIDTSTYYITGQALGTPASGNLVNCTFPTLNQNTTGYSAKASTLAQGGGTGAGMTFNWAGQSGQPTYLWGSNDGSNIYVWNPANFSVSSATQATNATNLNGTASVCGYSTSGAAVSYGGAGGPQVMGQGSSAAMMSFHRPGSYAINFGLDTDNVLKVGGWSMGGVAYTIMHSGNIGSQSVNYATTAGSAPANGGNANSVNNQSFSWSNASDSPSYVWAANSNGSAFLAARANLSVNYANSAGSANGVAWGNVSGKPAVATSRGEGSNYIDHSRYVYNNGAYSGSGWIEPSDLGVRYASSAGSASSATTAGTASSANYVHWNNVGSRPAYYGAELWNASFTVGWNSYFEVDAPTPFTDGSNGVGYIVVEWGYSYSYYKGTSSLLAWNGGSLQTPSGYLGSYSPNGYNMLQTGTGNFGSYGEYCTLQWINTSYGMWPKKLRIYFYYQPFLYTPTNGGTGTIRLFSL